MNDIINTEQQLLTELINYQSKPKVNNADYSSNQLLSKIQYTKFPETRNYQGISTGEVGYAPSNEDEMMELALSGKTYEYNPMATYDRRLGVPVDNPKIKLNPEFYMHHRDEQQDKAFLQGLNPDQIQRREKAVPKNTYNDYVAKGYSGLSSESINRDLLLWSVRGKQVVGRNRQLYKGFI
jgi:hypothetical protein